MSKLSNKYVEELLRRESNELKAAGLVSFNLGYDRAAHFLYEIANGLDRQVNLLTIAEQNAERLRQDHRTVYEKIMAEAQLMPY